MNTWLISFRLLIALSLLTGGLYPAAVTLAAHWIFPRPAEGSLVVRSGRVVGSELLAQRFADPKYFWPRPSTGDDGTNFATVASVASQLGPTSQALQRKVAERAVALRVAHGLAPDAAVPAELVLASGSGLDPHLPPAAVWFQFERVVRAREFDDRRRAALRQWIERLIEPPQFGALGEARVNVLRLNLEVDAL